MKTLQRFWQWVDNEKPGALDAANRLLQLHDGEPLISTVGRDALEAAALLIVQRKRAKVVSQPWDRVYWCLVCYRKPLRDLSLGIALDVTLAYAQLPAPPPEGHEPAKEPSALDKLQQLATRSSTRVVAPPLDVVNVVTPTPRGSTLIVCPRCRTSQARGDLRCVECDVGFLYVPVPWVSVTP